MHGACIFDECQYSPAARGLCHKHYQWAKSAGTLEEVAPKVHPPCSRCGGTIPQERRFGARFCSATCKDAAMDARKHEVAMARRASRRVNCAWCETQIEQVRSDQRFCSIQCGQDWRNEQT